MKIHLDIPNNWHHDFDISRCGKFITLKLKIPNIAEKVGHRAKRITINAMFDCFQFQDRTIQQTLINLLDEMNRQYYSKIEIFPK
ncbi:hypothetical protein BvCmsHHP006_02048 [Escherichia coli]|nr:hypothetical protein BvCmsHHP006_02048 [Escherichia coli]